MASPFFDLSIILFLATILSVLTRVFKQPLIIGYILTGLIVGPYFAGILKGQEAFSLYSQLGISLLLFLVGLHLSPQVIKELGKSAILMGLYQVVVTLVLGLTIAYLLGFGFVESALIGLALTFSSTIIVLKTLADKNELESLPSKLSIGILLVQDLIAMIVLVFLGGSGGSLSLEEKFVGLLGNGLLLAGVLIIFISLILPKLSKFIAKSQEVLFLFSISYSIGLAALFSLLGFSIEIGSLIAGVSLTFFPYHQEIASKLRPLRDFFIILFFILLGSQIVFNPDINQLIHIVVFTGFVLIVKPFVASFLALKFGYKHKTSLTLGLSLGQVSEFSLILLAKNIETQLISENILSVITIVALISIAFSSYEMIYSRSIYNLIQKYFKKLKQSNKSTLYFASLNTNAVLFGYNRVGYDILKAFNGLKLKYLVVDYDPEMIQLLKSKNVSCQYGDLADLDFIGDLPLKSIDMIVSTVPDFEANINMLKLVRKYNKKCIVILLSHNIQDAKALYDANASYVILPHFLGAQYAEGLILDHGINQKKFQKEKLKHINYLNKRLALGHEHPLIEKNYKISLT